tara:strand:- start:448 stop:606 length:159 start_codon:yes stop_codon:yes gene_type:complete
MEWKGLLKPPATRIAGGILLTTTRRNKNEKISFSSGMYHTIKGLTITHMLVF